MIRFLPRWALGVPIGLLPLAASALSVTYNFTGTNPNSGQPISASAAITTNAGSVSLTLNNLLANPNDVSQLISDVRITLGATTTGATLTNSSGTELTVNANDTFTLGSNVATGWSLTTPTTSTLYLNVLGTAIGPEHLIIGGPGANNLYSNANGSISSNDAHNPFLQSGATFTIGLAGVTTTTPVNAVALSFGTTPGLLEVPGFPSGAPPPGVPDGGTTIMMLGAALLAIGAARRFVQA